MMRRIWLLAAVVLMLGRFGISVAQEQAKSKKLNLYTGNLKAIEEAGKLEGNWGQSWISEFRGLFIRIRPRLYKLR